MTQIFGGEPTSSSAARMERVVLAAKTLSAQKRDSPNGATTRVYQAHYDLIVRAYTNPFNVNKWVS